MSMDRRDFLRTAAVGTVAGVSLLAGCTAQAASGEAGDGKMDAIDIALAKIAVRDKICEYSISMDLCNAEVGYNCFTVDSHLDYGPTYQGDGKGFVDMCCKQHFNLTATNHWMPMTYVVIDSETEAHSITWGGNFCATLPAEDGSQTQSASWCRYYDKWRKEADGQWRIYYREVGYEIFNSFPVVNDYPISPGTRDANDIHYKYFPEQL